ncbi:hypothetical protein [Streptomyces sp. NPDC048659]
MIFGNYLAVIIDPYRARGGDPRMNTCSDLGRLAHTSAWVHGRIAHGC